MVLEPELQRVIDTEWNNYYKSLTVYDEIELLPIQLLIDLGCYPCGDILDPDSLYWFVREWRGWQHIKHYGISMADYDGSN